MGANAQTTVPTFTASQVLTADQMNQSARTGVPVFASTTTRDAGFGGTGEKTLAEGQMCYVEGTGFQTYNGTAWVTWGTAPSTGAVVQVKSAVKTDTFSTSSTTYTDVTGLSIAITPTSASNKILIIGQVSYALANNNFSANFRFSGGNSTTYVGASPSSRVAAVFGGWSVTNQSLLTPSGSMVYLDSPATTSATTYVIQTRVGNSGTLYVNRSADDVDDANRTRGASSITVMEVTP